MTGADLLTRLRAAGFKVALADDGTVLCRARPPLPEVLLAEARANRGSLIAALRAEQIDALEERAGIAEHDGGLRRTAAEILAVLSAPPPDGVDPEIWTRWLDARGRDFDFLRRASR